MMHWGEHGWVMGFGWTWMVLIWGLVIAGIVFIMHALTGGHRKP